MPIRGFCGGLKHKIVAPVAQWIERPVPVREAVGPIPTRRTLNKTKKYATSNRRRQRTHRVLRSLLWSVQKILGRQVSGVREKRKSAVVQDAELLQGEKNIQLRGLHGFCQRFRLQEIQQSFFKNVRPDLPFQPPRLHRPDQESRP